MNGGACDLGADVAEPSSEPNTVVSPDVIDVLSLAESVR